MRRWIARSALALDLCIGLGVAVLIRERAEPKAYLVPLAALVLIALSWLLGRSKALRTVVSCVGAAACVSAVASGWALPLSKAHAAQLLEARWSNGAPVHCMTPPSPGGFPEFGRQLFGRIYTCGTRDAWSANGGIRPGQGVGVEVDDKHIVQLYP
jgi:hypothetical protein